MKFAWKIFIVTYSIIIMSFGIGGFILINSLFESNLENRINSVLDSHEYVTSSYSLFLISTTSMSDELAESYRERLMKETENSRVYIGSIVSNTSFYPMKSFVNQLKQNNRGYQIIENEGEIYFQAISQILNNGKHIYIESCEKISDVYTNRDENYRLYQVILLVVAVLSGALLYVFCVKLTSPLKRLALVAREIGDGNFEKRVKVNKGVITGTKEVVSLSNDFNKMAGYVETYINELKEEGRRREEFVGNFTHELKTPLTSIIGYADLLRNYDLSIEKKRDFAEFIFKEGNRLEALALNLLEMIVLRKSEFELQNVSAEILFNDCEKATKFILEKYDAQLEVSCEEAILSVEPNLVKTLIYNLIDNACKAMEGENRKVFLSGNINNEGRYTITVKDTGKGIPSDEISKITEAFYMVDKSRARKQGGAGLGLALCQEIANIHNSDIYIESELEVGTKISFSVAFGEYKDEEED